MWSLALPRLEPCSVPVTQAALMGQAAPSWQGQLLAIPFCFLIEVELISNITLVPGTQHSDSAVTTRC